MPLELALPFGANAYFLGDEDVGTGIQLQNLDRQASASMRATLYDAAGHEALAIDKTAAPGGAPNIYLPSHRFLDGLLPEIYSLLVRADRPIGSIVRTDWARFRGSAIYSYVRSDSDIVVPYLVRRPRDLMSFVSIQNAGTAPAEVRAAILAGGLAPERVAELGPYTIAPGAAVRIHLAHESELLRFRDLRGWMRVTATGSPVAVQSYVFKEAADRALLPVMGFEGVPATAAASRLLVPLFRSGQRVFADTNRADTAIAVANPGSQPVQVNIAYFGSNDPQNGPACQGRTFSHGAVTIPPDGSHIFSQAQGGGHGLPNNCFGSALVTTADPDQRVVATVLDLTNADALMSAYDALPEAEAGSEVALPLFRHNHFNLTTGIQVMNAYSQPNRIRIQFYATNAQTDQSTPIGGCTVCDQVVEPLQSYTWWPPSIAAIPPNTFGSAFVTADAPFVALVVDYPMQAQVDPAAYLGITAR